MPFKCIEMQRFRWNCMARTYDLSIPKLQATAPRGLHESCYQDRTCGSNDTLLKSALCQLELCPRRKINKVEWWRRIAAINEVLKVPSLSGDDLILGMCQDEWMKPEWVTVPFCYHAQDNKKVGNRWYRIRKFMSTESFECIKTKAVYVCVCVISVRSKSELLFLKQLPKIDVGLTVSLLNTANKSFFNLNQDERWALNGHEEQTAGKLPQLKLQNVLIFVYWACEILWSTN